MKRIILFVLSLIFCLILNAQAINKRDRLIGGSFSFSLLNYNYNDPRYNYGNNAGLFPSFGCRLKKTSF